MKKDASIFFGISFTTFIIFTLLFSKSLNDIMSSLSDLDNFLEIIQNIGFIGYFYLTMSASFFLISLVALFKAFGKK